ncbi:MAG TPA: DNA internalization-related competence protein ComEC/Rec2 [Eggerthellaceae bacterium]|nr:DNA internalization-related competence protein ComEC/Rec2 [Eggerthellaceae bacterium]
MVVKLFKDKRPSIPLLFWNACSLWLGCYIASYIIPYPRNQFTIIGPFLLSLFLIICFVFCLIKQKKTLIPTLGIFFILGMLIWNSNCLTLNNQRNMLEAVEENTVLLRVIEDPEQGTFGDTTTVEVKNPNSNNLIGIAYLYLNNLDFNYGDELLGSIAFNEPKKSSLSYFNTKGIAGTIAISDYEIVGSSKIGMLSHLRNSFSEKISNLIHEGIISDYAGSLLQALIVGDRTQLFSLDLYQQIKVLGLAHLVAVSGSHLIIVMGFIGLILKTLHISKPIAIVIQILFLGIYLIMVGIPISCVRAALMSAISMLAFSTSRRSHALSGLGIVIVLLVVIIPSSAFSLSFTLSVFSTFGIVVLMPLFNSWINVNSKLVKSLCIDPLSLTFAALLFTIPFTVSSFSMISLIAPIANVFAGPFITIICCVGLLAFVVSPFEPLCSFLLLVCGHIAQVFCLGSKILAAIPFAAVPLYIPAEIIFTLTAIGIVSLWILWPKSISLKKILFILAISCIALLCCFVPKQGSNITMLDVGQGDAFLITSNSKTVLIDTGNNPQALYAALSRQKVFSLNAILITHADDDHCGCLKDLQNLIPCEKIFLAKGIDNVGTDKTNDLVNNSKDLVGESNIEFVSTGDTISLDSLTFHIISPQKLNDEGGNQDSICFVLDIDSNNNAVTDWKAFFCGDAEQETVSKLIDEGLLSDIDVLKVAHHGSKESLSDTITSELSPDIALISVGENNRYGHPTNETLSCLENAGCIVARTDLNGDVICSFTPEKITVKTLR